MFLDVEMEDNSYLCWFSSSLSLVLPKHMCHMHISPQHPFLTQRIKSKFSNRASSTLQPTSAIQLVFRHTLHPISLCASLHPTGSCTSKGCPMGLQNPIQMLLLLRGFGQDPTRCNTPLPHLVPLTFAT